MSKNSKKIKKHRNRRRNAHRRAARAAERRTRGPSRERPRMTFTAIPAGGFVGVADIPGEEISSLDAYVRAHDRLPPSYPFDEVERGRQLAMALCVLEDRQASGESLLRAIMILGHIPDPRALEALRAHAKSRRPHADIARHAADECAMWLEDARGQPEPTSSPMSMFSMMLN